jgi:hypothetical protein
MKKILTLLTAFLLCLLTTDLLAQNVGIGTATPAFKLDVNGRMRVKTGTLGNVSTSSGIWLEDYRDGANQVFIGMQDSIRAGFYGTTAGWEFNFNANTGAVGIGRAATGSRLEIDDPTGGDIGFYSNGIFSGRLMGTDSTLQLYSAYGSTICLPGGCPAKDLILQPPPALFGIGGNVGIGTNAPAAKLHITSNVMIGTGTPAAGYLLSVNGKIMSEEVRVQLDANWPDYVFNSNYKLRPLDELEQFITTHRHLPDIPSAKEVEKEGIALGDMQKRLMEKVEELTLYVIQLDKENKQLKTEVTALKEQVKHK